MLNSAKTPNLSLPLASVGYVQFRQSYTTAMKILSAATGLTLPVVTAGTVVWRANLISNLGKIAAYKGVSLPTPALGLVAMRTAYVSAMTMFDGLIGSPGPEAPTQDNTLAGNTTLFAGNSAWKARFQSLETRFTDLGVA